MSVCDFGPKLELLHHTISRPRWQKYRNTWLETQLLCFYADDADVFWNNWIRKNAFSSSKRSLKCFGKDLVLNIQVLSHKVPPSEMFFFLLLLITAQNPPRIHLHLTSTRTTYKNVQPNDRFALVQHSKEQVDCVDPPRPSRHPLLSSISFVAAERLTCVEAFIWNAVRAF